MFMRPYSAVHPKNTQQQQQQQLKQSNNNKPNSIKNIIYTPGKACNCH